MIGLTRRSLFLAIFSRPLWADDARDIWDLFTAMAAALSEGNVVQFLEPLDRSMAEYHVLESAVSALLRESEVRSSIELLSDEGSGSARAVELDWFLELVEQQDDTNVTRRRERVRASLKKTGRKWKIVSLEPLAFFAPPAGRG